MNNALFTNALENLNTRRFLIANPVERKLAEGGMSIERAQEVVRNYAKLADQITRLLWRANAGAFDHGLAVIVNELRRNIAEEDGSRTDGVSHYHILLGGIRRELGFVAHTFRPEEATIQLLEGVFSLCHQSLGAGLGAAYALESSATPELKVVARILNHYADATGQAQPVSQETLSGQNTTAGSWTLDQFFAGHIHDFEPGHEDGLRQALIQELPDDQTDEFLHGFHTVLDLMDAWWDALAA